MPFFTAIVAAVTYAVGAVSTFIGGLGAIGAFALKTAVGIGLNLLAQAIAGKPKDPAFPISGEIGGGGDLGRSFIVGRYATAGSLVWINSWGKDDDTENAYLTYVIALSDLPVKLVDELWVNGENSNLDMAKLVTSSGDDNVIGLAALAWLKEQIGVVDDFLHDKLGLALNLDDIITMLFDKIEDLGGLPVLNAHQADVGFPVASYNKDGDDHLWVKFYDGTQTVVDDFLTTKAASSAAPWDVHRVGYGVAYAIITVRNKKNMFAGFPKFKFIINGTRLYDISKDTSAGGDGDQRWDDPSTWGGDGDVLPAVQAYNLLRGISWDGQWLYGVQGLAAARLPAGNWIAQINKCREPIEGADGPEPTYRCSGEIQIDVPLATALEAILTSCQGRISEVGGIYSIHVGAPDAPSFSFTDDDILSTEEQSFTPFFGLADTINGISATYPSPKEDWNVTTAPPIYRTDLEALAGNRRLMADVALNMVPYPEQVQRLMNSALLEGQRARRHTHRLPPGFWPDAVPGEICSWTSARNGYTTKLFRVDGDIDHGNLDSTIDITEVDPSDYDWDSGTDYNPPVDGAVGRILPTPQPIVDWFAEPWVIAGAGDRVRPGLKLSWDPNRSDIDGVEFQARLASTLEVVHAGRTDDYPSGGILISQNLFSLTNYEVRGRYIPSSEAHWDPLWSNWLAVTTPDVRDTDVLALLANLGADVKSALARLANAQDNYDADLQRIALSSTDMATRVMEVNAAGVRFRNATASALRQIDVSITDLDGQLLAQASITDALQATVGDATSGILWRMVATAGVGDVVSRVELQVRASIGNDWVSAATIWEAGFEGGNPLLPFGQIVLAAQKVVIADGLGNVSALFDPTGAYISNARIVELESANIKARSIFGDRIVTAGVDTPELALDSVTYVDSANTATPLAVVSSPAYTTGQIAAVTGYVSGGVLGAASLSVASGFAGSAQAYTLRVIRSASPLLTSPVDVGGNYLGYNTMVNSTNYPLSAGFSDVPPSAGDWYYGIQILSALPGSAVTQSITVSHAKR